MSNIVMNARFQIRNDAAANWALANPVLAKGEVGVEIDTKKIKVGDGATLWANLGYAAITPEDLAAANYGDMKKATYDTNGDGKVNAADVADKVANKITIGAKSFDGSTAVNITATDIGALVEIPSDFVQEAEYANTTRGGTVKSSASQDKVSVGADGIMTVNNISGSKIQGAVATATKLAAPVNINGVAFDGSANITVADATKIPASEKGAVNGVATLDATGKIPSTQLPSYVDDVIEAASLTALNALAAGDKMQGKIYVTLDTNTTYRWSGTAFIAISNPLDIATQAEAQSGSDNTKVMTPLRVKEAIAADTTKEPAFSKNTAFNKAFASTTTTLTSGMTGSAGSATTVAKGDHTHSMPTIPTTLPPSGTASGDLTGSYPSPTIGLKKVTAAKIADGTITDTQMASASLNVAKLFIAGGDVLIFNGGNA